MCSVINCWPVAEKDEHLYPCWEFEVLVLYDNYIVYIVIVVANTSLIVVIWFRSSLTFTLFLLRSASCRFSACLHM
ncbi:hypothetical protein F7725_021291 [Dissostichus mawsoni]|uniref:Uncharacterized protein n=1 Tax=Dissostichus mawsoni TaxID=36200 RepID=A0A7J5YGJ6_DISMA|nr:hypothetical protein F7725_021291 [Dissostichus mawsoni]